MNGSPEESHLERLPRCDDGHLLFWLLEEEAAHFPARRAACVALCERGSQKLHVISFRERRIRASEPRISSAGSNQASGDILSRC